MPDPCTEHDRYVSKINWLIACDREDLVDEIANEFERPQEEWTVPAAGESGLRRVG